MTDHFNWFEANISMLCSSVFWEWQWAMALDTDVESSTSLRVLHKLFGYAHRWKTRAKQDSVHNYRTDGARHVFLYHCEGPRWDHNEWSRIMRRGVDEPHKCPGYPRRLIVMNPLKGMENCCRPFVMYYYYNIRWANTP